MGSIFSILDGKKTYIAAAVAALLAGAQALGYDIPQWLYVILGAFGMGSLRAAVTKSASATATSTLQFPK